MNIRKLCNVFFSVIFALVIFLPLARASEENQQTKVTFSQPVEIPGRVLPAGSYWFVRLVNSPDIVQVFSLDWKTLYATELTAPAERRHPPDGPTFTFAERPSSKPEALVTWFYPGESIGHEFLYHQQEEKELAQDQQRTVVATPESRDHLHAGF